MSHAQTAQNSIAWGASVAMHSLNAKRALRGRHVSKPHHTANSMARAIVAGSSRSPADGDVHGISAPRLTSWYETSDERVNATAVATRNGWNMRATLPRETGQP